MERLDNYSDKELLQLAQDEWEDPDFIIKPIVEQNIIQKPQLNTNKIEDLSDEIHIMPCLRGVE